MVLGLKSKHKKGVRVRLEYIVHVQEVRPWPPSEALRSVQTVVLQWENGDQNSGSFLSVAGNSSIVFNESFLLPLTLKKDKKVPDTFKKNYLEFSLCEPRKDKGKGQVLGTAIINLADYVVMGETIGINAPINFKKSSSNSVQPALSISLEPVERESTNSSPSTHLSKGAASWDYDDSEIASFTDEDASSHSSRRSSTFEYALALSPQSEKNGRVNADMDFAKDSSRNFLPSATTDASSDFRKKSAYASSSRFPDRTMSYVQRNSVPPSFKSSPSSISFRDTDGKLNSGMANSVWITAAHNVIANKHKSHEVAQKTVEDKSSELLGTETISVYDDRKDSINSSSLASLISQRENPDEKIEQKDMESDDSRLDMRKTPAFPPSNGNVRARLKHVKSVQIHGSVKGSELLADTHSEGKLSQKKGMSSVEKERQEPNKDHSNGTNEWEARIALLEEELKEAAAVELALYSVVTEHSSSGNKVHAPARRMSRFYNNACGEGQAKRASAARAAVSGLVLVSRACGNDVPRLTFWLSNAIMLRAIVSQTAAELAHSVEGKKSKPPEESDDWEDILTFIIAIEKVESWLFTRIVESIWWQTFTPHMQPVVAKHSTRTTGSVTKKTNSRRNNSSSSHHELGSFSIELWKKAFKDACERLCPIRASGHECGCLSALVVLVMEQLVDRLDVAMFNAILRESDEEMPTDPVSDPISDSKVLPIPAGKSSFTAGAQLKNVIGNWSRWLSDLFGLEDNSFEDNAVYGDGHEPKAFKAFRLLHALSDLMMLPFEMVADASTRKEVCPLLGPAIIRRILNNFVPDEFCPVPIPKYIIDALNSEETSDSSGDAITSLPCSATPTRYSPPPAALMTCVGEVGSQVLKSSRLSSVKKSFNSDDELDELDSPLTSIIPDSYQSSSALAKLSLMSKEKYGRDVLRYKLLRETWKDEE